PEDYTEVAGWTLTPDGERRNLYREPCLRLEPTDGEPATDAVWAMRSGRPLAGVCPNCRLPLVAALELPPAAAALTVDLDAETGAGGGGGLSLPACPRGGRDGILFARLAADAVPAVTVRPRHRRLDPRGAYRPLPSGTLAARGPRRTPFETH